MMNYIWGGMLIIGIIFGVVTGNMQAVTDAVLQSSKEAVTLGISMFGIVAFLDRADGSGGRSRSHSRAHKADRAIYAFLVSSDSQRP